MKLNCRDVRALVLFTLFVILSPAVLSGCIETPSSRHVTAKQTLLGKSESEVLACAGKPPMHGDGDRAR